MRQSANGKKAPESKEKTEMKWEKIRSHNEIHHNLNVIQWIEIITVERILSIQFNRWMEIIFADILLLNL